MTQFKPSQQIQFDSRSPQARQRRQIMHDACLAYSRTGSKGHLKKLKELFKSFGSELRIESGFRCDYGDKISFGDRCYVNFNCTFIDGGNIEIGSDVLIGPNVQILTINHALQPELRLAKESYAQTVSVGDNVWIGAGAIILPGVSIGQGAVIGAGSLVTKNVPENHLAVGNPADIRKALI